jgi:hypothetical protein
MVTHIYAKLVKQSITRIPKRFSKRQSELRPVTEIIDER